MKKKIKKTKPPTLLERLASAAGAYYEKDQTRAGIVLSDLGNGVWYCSVVRYERGHQDKKIVCSTKQPSLALAVKNCAAQFNDTVRAPARLLRDLDLAVKACVEMPGPK